jgi:hypothetical protein
MVKVFKFGRMVPDMKVSGKKIKLVEKANSIMSMGIFLKDNG